MRSRLDLVGSCFTPIAPHGMIVRATPVQEGGIAQKADYGRRFEPFGAYEGQASFTSEAEASCWQG